jgi:Bacteriophage Sf6, terminase small subunit-like
MTDEIVEIADNATPQDAHVARLKVDARKWVAAKLLPKKYGDRPAEVNVNTQINRFNLCGRPATVTGLKNCE